MEQVFFKVKKHGIVLSPTSRSFEGRAVFNPGVFQEGNFVHLFYRAVNQKYESTIGYAKLDGPLKVVERWQKPFMKREFDFEKRGVEDAHITKIKDTFYFTYVAHDGKNAVTALATSKDLFSLKKIGIITPRISYDAAEDLFRKSKLKDKYFFFEAYYKDKVASDVLLWDKDVSLFSEKIKGKYAMLHRVLPDIQIVFFKDLKDLFSKKFWSDYLRHLSDYVVLENKYWFESRNIGGSCPPLKTKAGWLLIYHAVEEFNKGKRYHAAAALLDLKNPQKIIGRLEKPLFSPEEPWEKKGEETDVVFPSGNALFGDRLYIYYGAADKRVAVASVNLASLIKALKRAGQ